MSLHYILDGYNIIKSDNTGKLNNGSLEEQRNKLIDLINKNRPQGSQNNSITVVFDGSLYNPDSFWGTDQNKTVINGVPVIFSVTDNADRTIEKIVTESKNSSNLVVVTDDKGIRHNIGRSNAKLMSTQEFSTKLFGTKKETGSQRMPEQDTDSMDRINDEFKEKWLKNK